MVFVGCRSEGSVLVGAVNTRNAGRAGRKGKSKWWPVHVLQTTLGETNNKEAVKDRGSVA
jgi:hypothetical protein